MLPAALRPRRTVANGIVVAAMILTGWPADRAAADAVAERGHDERFSWLGRPEAWEVRWSRPIPATAPDVVAGLVAWNEDGGVHAVRLADGLPAWRTVPPADTLLLPRTPPRRGRGASGAGPSALAVAGHLLFAQIDGGPSGPLLVCLDCSDTAEGRLCWSAEVPARCDAFDGPPVADHELCVIIARTAAGRGPLAVVAHDARDGVVVWRQTVGTTMAPDGLDHARGLRAAAFAGNLIVVADHAGGVWAFDRAGRPAWHATYEVPPRSRAAAPPADVSPVASAAPTIMKDGGVVIAPRDRGGLLALRSVAGGVRRAWEMDDRECFRIVGAAGDGVIVAPLAAARRGQLVAVAATDGRPLATGGDAASACGPAVLGGGVVLQPCRDPGGGPTSITVIDPITLRSAHPPFRMPPAGHPAPRESEDSAVHLAVAPRSLVIAGPRMLTCIGATP